MSGRPILQWLIFILLWSFLLIPIVFVTRSVESPVRDTAVRSSASTIMDPAWLSVRFSDVPKRFSFRADGEVVWSEDEPSGHFFERSVLLQPGEHGLEMRLQADFPEAVAVVAEVTLESSGGSKWSRTLWTQNPVDELVYFNWIAHE